MCYVIGVMKSPNWTFFTNHAHVLISLVNYPDRPLREVALQVGITERAVQRIVADLEEDGFLVREKKGRQNVYKLITDQPLRHDLESHRNVSEILELLKR